MKKGPVIRFVALSLLLTGCTGLTAKRPPEKTALPEPGFSAQGTPQNAELEMHVFSSPGEGGSIRAVRFFVYEARHTP